MITDVLRADKYSIELAGKFIREGKLVGVPTETVYGLAANAFDENAVSEIFKAKGRPQDNPLIVHIAEIDMLDGLVKNIPDISKRLVRSFWQKNAAPLTIVFEKSDKINNTVSAGLDTVAIRIPAHRVMLDIIRASGVPLAAPSANISGKPSPTSAKHVYDDLKGQIPLIIDGGKCSVGIESTVVRIDGEKILILRPGAVTTEDLRAFGDVEIAKAVYEKHGDFEKAESPGMKYRHYAPKGRVILVDGSVEAFIKYIGENRRESCAALVYDDEQEQVPAGIKRITFGKENDSNSQASRLFEALREADDIKSEIIFVRCPSENEQGVGMAVRNRLLRASDFEIIKINNKININNIKNNIAVIGLTGPSGAGKSAVSEIMREKGFYVIDADIIAREVVEPGAECLKKLELCFGKEIISADGGLDRGRMGELVFSDPKKLEMLNKITHPFIDEKIRKNIKKCRPDKCRGVVIDAAVLLESEVCEMCDVIISVLADRETRINRIIERDGLDRNSAVRRIGAQKDAQFYVDRSEYIIYNNSNFEELRDEVEIILERIGL